MGEAPTGIREMNIPMSELIKKELSTYLLELPRTNESMGQVRSPRTYPRSLLLFSSGASVLGFRLINSVGWCAPNFTAP